MSVQRWGWAPQRKEDRGEEGLEVLGIGAKKKEGEGQEEVQRRIRDSGMGKSRGLKRGLAAHLTHLRREVVVCSPRWAVGAP